MPSPAAMLDAYVRHALRLVRVSNGLVEDADATMRSLARQLRKLLAGENLAELGVMDLRALVKEADGLVYSALDTISGAQSDAVRELIRTEAEWAVTAGQYSDLPTETALTRAFNDYTIFGGTLDDNLSTIVQRLRNDAVSQLRLGILAGQTDREILSRINDTFVTARRNMRGFIDASTQAAADTGRRATMAANGVNAMQWSAKLDASVCPNCAERDGKVWKIDGEPVGHSIPWAPAPLHNWCRCIVAPMDIPDTALAEIEQNPGDTFSDWLDTLPASEQDDILGKGRAQLWRDDKITTADLIGQNGMVLGLGELL